MPIFVLFCQDPLNPRKPDEAYADEFEVANALGFQTAIFNFETLVTENDAVRAI